jgi:hypothetical protein
MSVPSAKPNSSGPSTSAQPKPTQVSGPGGQEERGEVDLYEEEEEEEDDEYDEVGVVLTLRSSRLYVGGVS